MRVFVLGANGLSGKAVVEALLKTDHELVILYHRTQPQLNSDKVIYIQGSALNSEDLNTCLEGVDAVLNCVGFGKGDGKATTFFSEINQKLIEAMRKSGTRRLITMSNTGVFGSGGWFVTRVIFPLFFKWLVHIIHDKERMETDLTAVKDLDWVSLRFPNIVEGPAQNYRSHPDGKGLSFTISTGTLAEIMVDQLQDDRFLSQCICFSH